MKRAADGENAGKDGKAVKGREQERKVASWSGNRTGRIRLHGPACGCELHAPRVQADMYGYGVSTSANEQRCAIQFVMSVRVSSDVLNDFAGPVVLHRMTPS